jgi:hypothetical protein
MALLPSWWGGLDDYSGLVCEYFAAIGSIP